MTRLDRSLIAGAALKLMRQAGRKTEDGILIDFPLSRRELAEMTGATLHTVSRTLCGRQAEGLLNCGRQKVVVRDEQGSAAISAGRE